MVLCKFLSDIARRKESVKEVEIFEKVDIFPKKALLHKLTALCVTFGVAMP